ncbi:thiouridylase [Azospirillum thiophilum]|uniref:tRNA-specific 2-thiouridylase MnmA n=1 Tax=Azospirillum thiophilum TaxID=528244 RepID=A0AAC8ZTV5_9PROT|nr:tRNA 2-thiouridine(34) synthase MnmA [Azospirillum thiophilum]ALG70987.1 thiouridylase [Azospirillum thiophilum]KJR65350.1 thiouridylase [Azospirillum thiophilum]
MNSLGLPKAPQDTRIVVAMSGGVDSSVTAALLREEGYDVVGITLQLYDHGLALQKPGACCAGQDIYDARQVADRIGIPHYVLDYEGRFSQDVMDDFADSYLRGETPIPCVRCNQRVKFRDLLNTARDLGADALATGHYVRRVAGPQGAELHRGIDPAKDQSYFLFATTREQLDFLRFPLGGLGKPETRALAGRFGLEVAAKPDSQDICFVPNGNYAEVVAKLRPGSVEPGDIVHVDGRVLGRHKGVVHYTVGQRKGLGIGGIRGQEEEALYVVRLEPARRRVVVGPRRDLARSLVTVRDVNWLGPEPADGDGIEVSVKLRSAQPAAAAVWRSGTGGTAAVELREPQHGIAPGQACVVYQGDRVLGGGWISATAGGVEAS